MRPSGSTLVVLGGVLCLAAAGASGATDAVRHEPSPPQPAPPSGERAQQVEDQLVRGRVAYGLNCISCHADSLQGLTDEWRATWEPNHQDCWKSKCHSFNHPPDGFIIPRWAPPLREAMLAKYETAGDLFAYISVAMPYQEPGILEDEKYWDIEAYILHENDLRWGDEPLGPENASVVLLRPGAGTDSRPSQPTPPPTSPVATPTPHAAMASQPQATGSPQRLLVAAGVIGLLIAGGGAMLVRRRGRG